ncbi:alanine--tRNA ligase [Patescibacteria group bacterium]|nr:alanine--tRNA ligase [Patescibacteria group bacterium]
MVASELRQKYLEFFKSKGHAIIPSASLIPENDPTVLFTTAGMHPLVVYLLGENHPAGKRLVNVQKCIRTNDIDEVGDAVHHTFFEMLGNWSLGDYFKKEAITWSWEFLTSPQWLGLEKEKIAVSVFSDESAPFDEESYKIWLALGVPEKRIAKLPQANNWWGLERGGPCGPDTEMFYWVGSGQAPEKFDDSDSRWVEIWNDVFMQFNKRSSGSYEPLAQKNVDTGMGLERTLAVLNRMDDDYRTELFWPLIEKIVELSRKKYDSSVETTRAMRIIADHIKAATFILGDDKAIVPSNVDQGYVIRRLIRRAVRYGKQLGIENIFTFKVAEVVIEIYKDIYSELRNNKEFIVNQLVKEEEKFKKTLERGIKEYQIQNEKIKMQNDNVKLKIIPAEVAFNLYQTYGFPIELTEELAKEDGFDVDKDGFFEALKKHQELSRAGAEQKFKGGLADHSEQVVKYHTVAHLLLAALRKVLGGNVNQKGANITEERLRFDFLHGQKMTPEEIRQIEDMVNEKIKADLSVQMEEMGLEEAKAQGATGVFESRYGERVKVYTIADPSLRQAQGKLSSGPPFSREICGGPHVERTGILGKFKIIKEESSSAGVRRIKAVLE